ncbi:M15 family metallopeptidase [Humibacillus sp. DSM 29435]|uniref:M15 family metallopeptidase n=1 Tax=Humibacillus sp. DSM 29435 TaxID=1869167 RepID=UPI0009F39866|nr:M15 family metallopeptidase [Humibacillus sp. DSM 29435]
MRATTADDVRYTYRPGCPVGASDLRTITMTYRTYTGQVRTGVLIVAREHASSVVGLFRQAFEAGFRINRMDNPNLWKGDDVQMMAADNTSAFNCRQVTGNASGLSPHSYGTAIDVNTRRNPYRAANDVWYPSNGSRWIDRSVDDVGVIRSSSTITRALLRSGGIWGGTWADPDYQHFEVG